MRPIVEYAPVAWSPHTNKGIDCIKSVQRRGARFVNSDYSHYSSVSPMLTDLNWPSLQSRRRICDLGMLQVRSTSPFPMTLPPYLRMAVQGRFTTLRSGYHPLQSTLTNTPYMRDQSLRVTRYQLMLLVRHPTQNLSEECPLL